MNLEPISELALAHIADYERLVNRLLLEREAKAANAESRARNPQPNRRYLPWSVGWHRHGATN
ncbi:hypothetical protein [Candidatus Amarobacter glycogenicus]|uniref:hypothetical protein n=1 Tax=Candidatus Amarobacter glycogenicus TaxID=3140699 RepID=UPI003136374C|nr:hypothetical protein [Dehalococcoidia bacterium]